MKKFVSFVLCFLMIFNLVSVTGIYANASYNYLFPVKNGKIAYLFGYTGYYGGEHFGIDIHSTGDDTIYAACGGVVDIARVWGTGGNTIRIHQTDGNYAYYCHLASYNVSAGQTVIRGQAIGVMGSTGNSTGKHLHFEVRTVSNWTNNYNNTVNVNPCDYSNAVYIGSKSTAYNGNYSYSSKGYGDIMYSTEGYGGSYYFDVNLTVNGASYNGGCGSGDVTFDVYLNNSKVATGCTDYYKNDCAPGTTYKIDNIKVGGNYVLASNSVLTGTVNSNSGINIPVITPSKTKTAKYKGNTYEFYSGCTNWKSAKEFAERKGGHLVTVTTENELQFLNSNFSGSYWLGATDEEKEGTWKWVNSEKFSYSKWNIDEPNNCDNSEHYLGITYNNKWNDYMVYSEAVSGFVIEYECEHKNVNTVKKNVTCTGDSGSVQYKCADCSYSVTVKPNEYAYGFSKNVDSSIYQTKTMYRKSVYEKTTSEKSKLDGWVALGPTYSDYGAWSDYSATPVTANDLTEVRTAPMYCWGCFICPNCGLHEPFRGTCDGCGGTLTIYNWSEVWSTGDYSGGISTSFGKVYWDFGDKGRYYSAPDNAAITGYSYRTRTILKYNYERWTNYSKWQDSKIEANANTKVESATFIKLRNIGTKSHTWNSGVVTKAATATSTGIKTYTCTVCKATKTETIAKLTVANVTGGKTSSTTNNSVILLWNKVANATGYKIYTYNASTKKYSVYKTVTTNSASIGGLLAGTRYDFYVKAYVGTNSNYITSNGYHIIKVMTKPANISGLSYTATTSSVTLKWNKVAKVTGYKIYTYNASTKTYSVYKIVSTNSVTLTGLSAGSRYDFYVKAYRTSGSFTAASKDYQIIRVMTNPANVSGLTYTATTSSVTLKWSKVARATGYKIYTYNSSTGKYTCLKTVTTNTATITGLKSKVGNTYYVKAYRTFNSASYFSPNYSQIFAKTK